MLYTFAKVLYTSNIGTQEVEVEGPRVQGLPGLCSKTLKKKSTNGNTDTKTKGRQNTSKKML